MTSVYFEDLKSVQFLQSQFGSLLEVNTFFVTFLEALYPIDATNEHKLHQRLKKQLAPYAFLHLQFLKGKTLTDANGE